MTACQNPQYLWGETGAAIMRVCEPWAVQTWWSSETETTELKREA